MNNVNSNFLCAYLHISSTCSKTNFVYPSQIGLNIIISFIQGKSSFFLCRLWSPSHIVFQRLQDVRQGKGLTSWLLFVMFIVIVSLSHLVSLDT